ncbi:hypothetical protein [Polaribacter atrinae]|uniref:hypothetical protein n=1 Tax=Polaribacter atrinae TaxID=1333662 RepID=UPI0024920E03|nr:hypothetical protein [Polaribacter atrinae]
MNFKSVLFILFIVFASKLPHKWSYIHYDSVENWCLFNIGEAADNTSKFWKKYALN